jgi:hypothetical protein
MKTIRTVIHDRRIEVPAPEECPDGTEVLVEVVPVTDKIGLDESEWRNDADALADWAAWIGTIEPVAFEKPGAFEEEFRRINIEAVRKQMSGETP